MISIFAYISLMLLLNGTHIFSVSKYSQFILWILHIHVQTDILENNVIFSVHIHNMAIDAEEYVLAVHSHAIIKMDARLQVKKKNDLSLHQIEIQSWIRNICNNIIMFWINILERLKTLLLFRDSHTNYCIEHLMWIITLKCQRCFLWLLFFANIKLKQFNMFSKSVKQ